MNTEETEVLAEKIASLAVGKAKQIITNKYLQEKCKEFEDIALALDKKFTHLAFKHEEAKSNLKLANNELKHYENQTVAMNLLQERVLQYETEMLKHPEFKHFFKDNKLKSTEQLGLPWQ